MPHKTRNSNAPPLLSSPNENERFCSFNRPSLGRFQEKVYLQKLRRGEKAFGEFLNMGLDPDMCGIYERGTVLKGVKVVFNSGGRNSSEFLTIHRTISDEERNMLEDVPYIKLRNTHRMYQSNPYTSDIGTVKLFFDETRRVHRCIIEDLFCAARQYGNSLALEAAISLIDEGRFIKRVDYKYIYDFSQRTSYLQDIAPEAIQCRLHLPSADNGRIAEIHDLLRRAVSLPAKSTETKMYSIKILDYQDKYYHVDVTTELEQSFLEAMKKRFQAQDESLGITSLSLEEEAEDGASRLFMVLPQTNLSMKRSIKVKRNQKPQPPQQISLHQVPSAAKFFKHLIVRHPEPNCCLMSVRLCKVMLLDWVEPDQLTILPYERDYSHERFMMGLKSLKCVQQAGLSSNIKETLYTPGEYIFFRNVFEDDQLGPWLRGVVVSLTCYNKHNLIIAQRRSDEAKKANFREVQQLVSEGKVHRDDIIYRVRSVDYGCECRSSPFNMRCVHDLKEFTSLGTWSLRCKLFGVYPYEEDDGDYTEFSLDAFTSWINQRYEDDQQGFRVLFRDFLDTGTQSSFDKLIQVSLFHRYEPGSENGSQAYLLHPEPSRFDCLNWHMVERGLASSSPPGGGSSSNIQLEDHVITQLVVNSKL